MRNTPRKDFVERAASDYARDIRRNILVGPLGYFRPAKDDPKMWLNEYVKFDYYGKKFFRESWKFEKLVKDIKDRSKFYL